MLRTGEQELLEILIVEDDDDARANLRDILELNGCHITEAGTAAEAVRRDDWPRYAAIILDRQLPDGSAADLLPRFRVLAPEAAVIVVTGYSDLQGAIAALRQGASDYILKPLNPDALLASLERIAERRRLRRARERSDAAFRLLVEAAECFIVILRPDRTIAYFSPFAERLTGRTAAEVVGADFFDVFLAEPDRAAVVEEFRRGLAGQPTHGYQNPIVCRDGSRRWMVWNSRLLADYEDGSAILSVGQDITGLRQAQERTLQASRLAAIGQMVAGLAHESRNALQRSQACLEMLALNVRDRPEAIDLIGRIQSAQDHLTHLYDDVRNYAAPIVLDLGRCTLSEIWRDAWAQLEPARKARPAELHEHGSVIDFVCSVDRFRLGQVFRNVFENALAAAIHPLRIDLEVRPTALDGQPALQVTIRDDGPGMAPEVRRQVFEPFFTTRARGTGLGLAITRRIVEAHGGQIAVADEGPPGAAFILTIPRGSPPP